MLIYWRVSSPLFPLSSNPREFPKIQDVKDPIYIKIPWGKGLPSGKLV